MTERDPKRFQAVGEIEEALRRIPSDRYPLAFSDAEYADRLKRCREAMAAARIDLLFVTWPEGMCYLHGYEVSWLRANSAKRWFPYTATAVHVDFDRLILLGGEDAVPSAAKDRRAIPGSGLFSTTGREVTPQISAAAVADELAHEGWLKQGTRVGLEFWSYVPCRAVSEVTEQAFRAKGAQVVDGSDILRAIRQLKSPAEIAALEHAARIGDIGMRAVARAFKPGMTHAEVYAESSYAMLRAGGEVPGIAQDVQPGRPRTTHLLPSRRRIEAGEPFAVDIAGVHHRYHANVDRTFVWGDPEPELVRMNEAAKGALDVLAKHARAGTPVADVSRALREYYEAVDLWQYHGYCGGYELGIALPPDWCGEFLWSVADEHSREVFGANLVTNYENTFRNENTAYRYPLLAFSRDTVVYEATGARCLSNIPLGLVVLG
jgi:Xaa-Pro dipeptidase